MTYSYLGRTLDGQQEAFIPAGINVHVKAVDRAVRYYGS